MKRMNKSVYSILGILSSGPKSGYDIKKTIERSIGHFWAESYGQIYPTLKLLIDEGLITMEEEDHIGKLDRKVYSITYQGMEELLGWLSEPVEDITLGRNELLLKLFFGDRIQVDENINHLKQYEERLYSELYIYNGIEENLNSIADKCPRLVYQSLTLKHGQAICKALIEWCEDSMKTLYELRESTKKSQ